MSALDAISQTSTSTPYRPTTTVGKATYAIYAIIMAPLRSSSFCGGGSSSNSYSNSNSSSDSSSTHISDHNTVILDINSSSSSSLGGDSSGDQRAPAQRQRPPDVDKHASCAGLALDRSPALRPRAPQASDPLVTPVVLDHASSVLKSTYGDTSSACGDTGPERGVVAGAHRAGVRECGGHQDGVGLPKMATPGANTRAHVREESVNVSANKLDVRAARARDASARPVIRLENEPAPRAAPARPVNGFENKFDPIGAPTVSTRSGMTSIAAAPGAGVRVARPRVTSPRFSSAGVLPLL